MPEVIFNGPDGRLEGRYYHCRQGDSPIAIILHPDPRYGGTMNNKVVFSLFQTFVHRKFSTLRFNFRGVGRSEGRFDHGHGELGDGAAALDWVQSHNPNAPRCWIAGFSFGAWIGMQMMMRRPEISGFISLAPPASVNDFTFLAPCPSSGLIIHGEKDEVVPVSSVGKLAQKLSSQKIIKIDYHVIPDADHFFQDQIETVSTLVNDYLDKALDQAA
jgi:alpha/beta superfamily hydrolase